MSNLQLSVTVRPLRDKLHQRTGGLLIPATVRTVDILRCTVLSIILRIDSTEMLASLVVPDPDGTLVVGSAIRSGSIASDMAIYSNSVEQSTISTFA